MIRLLAALVLPVSAHADAGRCAFESKPTIIQRADSGPNPILLQYWDLKSDRLLSERSLPESKRLAEYRAAVSRKLDTDPLALLKRYSALGPSPEDQHNIEQVMSRPESIQELGCLEALLLDVQLGRSPRFSRDGPEFIAYYLRQKGKLRVYFLTNDAAGIRGAGLSELLGRIDADKAQGWAVLANLHNHCFFLDDLASKKPQGVLAPSANDVRVFSAHRERFGLGGAFITNGFHTVHVPGQDIKLYKAAP